MSKEVKGALHHWWPRSLSQFWANDKGAVTWLAPDGTEKQSKHETWGAIRNGHTVSLGPGWKYSFEDGFGRADSNFPYVVEQLLQIDSDFSQVGAPLQDRLHPVDASEPVLKDLRECLASLIVRMPQNRNGAIRMVEYYRGPIENKRERDNLIALNLQHQLKRTVEALERGKFIFVFSTEREFIFGDGMYHNVSPGNPGFSGIKIVAPITPHMTVIYAKPTSYRDSPNAFSIRIEPTETDSFNEMVQVYAKDMIFFRNDRPPLLPVFARAEHLEYEYHRLPWLQEIIDAAAYFGGSRPASRLHF